MRVCEYKSTSKSITWGKWFDTRSLFFPALRPQNVFVGIEVLVKSTLDDIFIDNAQLITYHFRITEGKLTETLSFYNQNMQWQTQIDDHQIMEFTQTMSSLFPTLAYGWLPVEYISKKQAIPVVTKCLSSENIKYKFDFPNKNIIVSSDEGGRVFLILYDGGSYALHYKDPEKLDKHRRLAEQIVESFKKNQLFFCFV